MNDIDLVQKASELVALARKKRIGLSVSSSDIKNPVNDFMSHLTLKQLLTLLRQEIDETLRIIGIGSMEEVFKNRIPSDIADDIGERLFQICMIAVPIQVRLTKKVLEDNLIQPQSELIAFYKKEYDPYKDKIGPFCMELFCRDPENRKKIWGHGVSLGLGELSISEIEKTIGRNLESNGTNALASEEVKKLFIKGIEKHEKKEEVAVKDVFQILISSLEENFENAGCTYLRDYEGTIEKRHYGFAKLLVSSDYFQPDDWMTNINTLGPIFSPRKEEKFPKHIRIRIHEMYRSFLFGNWMSVLALGRSLLEYVIIDRRSSLGIEVYEKDQDGAERPKKISRLVDLAVETSFASPLERDMKEITKYGNGVMHPEKTKKVRMYPPTKTDALDCMQRIVKIIQILYKIKG